MYLGDQFIYLGSNISSTESDFNILIGKAWTTIDRLMTIWKSDLSDKIKRRISTTVWLNHTSSNEMFQEKDK